MQKSEISCYRTFGFPKTIFKMKESCISAVVVMLCCCYGCCWWWWCCWFCCYCCLRSVTTAAVFLLLLLLMMLLLFSFYIVTLDVVVVVTFVIVVVAYLLTRIVVDQCFQRTGPRTIFWSMNILHSNKALLVCHVSKKNMTYLDLWWS